MVLLLGSRYKNSKRQNFFTRTDKVPSSLFFLLQILLRSGFNVFSIQKIQRGRIFQRTDTVPSSLFFFANNYREVFFNAFSIQKIQRVRIFLLELTQSLRVYLLFCKYYREVVFNAFSIQKFKEAEFFTRTDLIFNEEF